MVNVTIFILGWILFVAGQAQNSVRSKTNGLPDGLAGFKKWIAIHWLDLLHRAFWCGLFYGVLVTKTTSMLQAVGLPVTSYMVAGASGWTSNSAIYQILGLLPFPGLRKEVSDVVPPANSEIVPVPAAPASGK